MPDTDSVGGGPDGALGWYNRTFAAILGLNPNDPVLPADKLSSLSSDEDRRAVMKAIDKRFTRYVNAETGAVVIDRLGDASSLPEPDEEQDAAVGDLAVTYLGAARSALGALDPGEGVSGVSADRIAGLLAEARATIDLVAADARRRDSGFQMYLHLDGLTHPCHGLMRKLTDVYESEPDDTVGRERILASLRVGRQALTSFEDAVRQLRDCNPTLGDTVDLVRGCGTHIARHARNVRMAFRGVAIGECELRTVSLPLGQCILLSGESFEALSLDQLLTILETEPARWVVLAAGGRRESLDTIVQSAATLRPAVAAIKPQGILSDLGLLGSASNGPSARCADVLFLIERLRSYVLSILDALLLCEENADEAGPEEKKLA
jgi:hypothetical protein